MKATTLESLASAAESIATVLALAAAGWWTFLLFIKKREKHPRARTTHSLVPLGELEGYRLMRVSVKIENLGGVLVDLCRGKVVVQAVRPLPDAWTATIQRGEDLPRGDAYEFPWPRLKEFPLEWGDNGYRIEPLESEEFHFDVVLGSCVEAVQIYSYFQNVTEKRREIGWNCTTVKLIQEEVSMANKPQEPPRPPKPLGPPKPPSPQGPPKDIT